MAYHPRSWLLLFVYDEGMFDGTLIYCFPFLCRHTPVNAKAEKKLAGHVHFE